MEIHNTQEYYERAKELFTAGSPEQIKEARRIFSNLLCQQPENAEFAYYLGTCYLRMEEKGAALGLLEKATTQKENFPEALNNLGYLYRLLGYRDKANERFKKAYDLAPKQNEYLLNYASAFTCAANPKKGIELCTELLKRENLSDKDRDSAHNNRAICYLELGDWKKGWPEYDYRVNVDGRQVRFFGPEEGHADWNGEKGKNVVIWGEQGIGDEIMFASMLPDAMKDAKVVLEAHPRLARLFRYNFPDIPVYGTRKDKTIYWTQFHTIDAQLAIGSLGKLYRLEDKDYPKTPYLKPEPVYQEFARRRLATLGDKPKVGISWFGGTPKTSADVRECPLTKWLPLFREYGDKVDFISLQYHAHTEKLLKDFAEHYKLAPIHHWPDILDSYDATPGLVSELDMIISVPQSVVHLAGAIGTTTYQLVPYQSLWQMGPRGKDMPWYESVKNIWQEKDQKWEPVIKQAGSKLCEYLKNTKN